MKYLSLILLLSLPVLAYSQAREITIPERAVAAPSDDLKIEGRWFIQFAQKDWEKTIDGKRFILFPDRESRSQQVLDLMASVSASFDSYIFEQISDGDYANGTDKLRYIAACIEGDKVCHIYIRENNKQTIISLERIRENATAAADMADIAADLLSLSTIATDTDDYQEH